MIINFDILIVTPVDCYVNKLVTHEMVKYETFQTRDTQQQADATKESKLKKSDSFFGRVKTTLLEMVCNCFQMHNQCTFP